MDQQLIEKVMRQVSDELGIKTEECKAESVPAECASQNIGMTEFVGTAMGDTIGLVIASVGYEYRDYFCRASERYKGRRRPRKLNLHRCRGCIRCQKSGRDRTSGSSEIFRRCIRK